MYLDVSGWLVLKRNIVLELYRITDRLNLDEIEIAVVYYLARILAFLFFLGMQRVGRYKPSHNLSLKRVYNLVTNPFRTGKVSF